MIKPRLALVGILAVSAIALVGCSSTPASESGDTGTDTSLSDVQEAGTLTIGTEGTYRPFTYHDASGDLTGYDVEIATAVAEKLGVEADFQETQWDAIFAGLDAGRFDIIANQVSITDEREEKYELSEPYTVSPGVVIVSDDNTDIDSLASLEGKTTAQSLSSNWYELAEANGANVEAVEGWAQAIALLEQGRVDATVNDKLTFLDYKATDADGAAGLKIAAETDDPSRNAFVVAKGSTALNDAVNDALDELRADGTLAVISEKYFGEDVTE
ncbi:cystine transport system substrate-binding protein [Conyzicola lurida]|uniref:Cystine transport system substrate-binding protein n=1 Tax=Conyzicola lurida TaxID=1172621 RepID=A0A841ALJ6_9MICO|nr:amino acid ABC transporter substrate-binding protein [Conyzicola lurida]MBB5843244.1 cystine transport system substrate-binding protein [Conyzicola lurida]